MIDSAGSYAFGGFCSNDRELERLTLQATVALDFEAEIWRRVGLRPGMKVLDLACGPGLITRELAKVARGGVVVGVDVSPELLEEARHRLREDPVPNLLFQLGDVYDLNLPNDTFDFVYCRLLFQHLRDPLAALQSIVRTMKPGGKLCIVDVDDDWLTLHPRPASFRAFTRWAASGQRRRGGDRNVGSKLDAYLRRGGLVNVDTFVKVMRSCDIGLRNFLDITTGFKHEQISPEHRAFALQALDEIYAVLDDPYAWGAVGVFVASGVKP